MYEYKSEILSRGIRWTKGSASKVDAQKLDELLSERAAEGWELVTYVYTTELLNLTATMLLTFRKVK